MYRQNRVFVSLFICTLVVACASPIKSSGPYKPDDKTVRNGQRYYVGKDVINITAEITKKVVQKVNEDLSVDANTYINSTVDVTKKLVPDYRQYYVLQVKPGGIYEDKITITSTTDGLLKTVSAETTGKAGEVIKDIGSIAANLLAITPVTSFSALSQNESICVKASKDIGLSLEHQFFARQSPEACDIINRIRTLKTSKSLLQSNIDQLRMNMASASDEEVLKKIKNKLAVKSEELKKVSNELASENTLYGALFNVFKGDKLAVTNNQITLKQTYDINELPTEAEVREFIGKGYDEVADFLHEKKYVKMEELFRKGYVVLSREIISPLTENVFTKKFPEVGDGERVPDNRIHFRQTYPFHVGEYKLEYTSENSDETTLQKSSSNLVSLIHPYSPIQYIEYSPSSFSKRKLDLTFDVGSGVLTSIVTDNGSSVSGASSSLSNTLKTTQTEYLSALGNIDTAQNKLNKIRLNDYQKEIDTLNKRKDLIDARVAFEGAEASQELLIEQKLMTEQLNTLNAELALAKAQSTYEQNLGLAKVTADFNLLSKQLEHVKTEITYEQKIEIEKLKTEILLLQEKVRLSEESK